MALTTFLAQFDRRTVVAGKPRDTVEDFAFRALKVLERAEMTVFGHALGLSVVLSVMAPEIDGDPRLFDVVLSAQRANLSRFPKGELEAVYRVYADGSSAPATEMHFRERWREPFLYCEFEKYNHAGSRWHEKQKGSPLSPVPARLLSDGKQCRIYYPTLDSPAGSMTIFPFARLSRQLQFGETVDQRPSVYWARCEGRTPWSEFMTPNPAFAGNGRIRKWVVRQERERIIIERHDTPYDVSPERVPEGIARFVTSMELAGHVVEYSYRSRVFSKALKQEWSKDAQGRVILRSLRSSTKAGERERKVELDIVAFDGDPTFSVEQFTPKALMLKWGAQVQDEIARRKYVYRDDAVTQEALKKLSKSLKSKAEK